MVVTEAMVKEKSLQSQFEGAVMISNKTMTQTQYHYKINQLIQKPRDNHCEKEHGRDIDARGYLVYGLIHCQGSEAERQTALIKVHESINNWCGDHSTARAFHYEDLLRIIVWFASTGEIKMNEPNEMTEIDKIKSMQMACILAESDTDVIQEWCLNAKEKR